MLKYGATIGIIGGGQLARMMAMAAARLGFKTIILEPDKNCPAAQTANHHIIAAYDAPQALEELAKKCQVITYEFENVPSAALAFLHEKVPLFPSSNTLEISQDRSLEKQFLNDFGIETAPWHEVNDKESLKEGLLKLRNKAILKTNRLGYDGKGQVRFENNDSLAFDDDFLENALREINHVPAILEGFVAFEKEISVIAARSQSGEIVFYDCPENIHQAGILRQSLVPATISKKTADLAKNATKKILEALNYVGVIAVEFFVLKNGTVIANEFAPRVHNSGHWTEAACAVSQFEQHIRAIANLPLAETRRHSDCVMENIIGDDMDKVPHYLNEPQSLLHLYGKSETRKGRKMGHITHLKL